MAYTKTIWKDRSVEYPHRFTSETDSNGKLTLTPAPGTVNEEGTPLNAENMNRLEAACAASDSGIFRAFTHTYDAGTKVHSFAGEGAMGIVTLSASFTAGDSISVNGTAMTAYAEGATLTAMPAGRTVTLVTHGSEVNFGFTDVSDVRAKAVAAQNAAATAQTTANSAVSKADTAINTANSAASAASTAASNASTAKTNAATALTTANTASANASTAVSTANSASSTATSAKATADSTAAGLSQTNTSLHTVKQDLLSLSNGIALNWYGPQYGNASMTGIPANSTKSMRINFASKFTETPIVVVSLQKSEPNGLTTSTGSIDVSGFTVYVNNSLSTTNSTQINYVACGKRA